MNDETPLFFSSECNGRLFGIIHRPYRNKQPESKIAIVYAAPIFEEKLHSHRILVNFARFAAGNGISVLRFDYRGDGESDGLFEHASISSRISDISTAIGFVKREMNPSKIFLLGLRFGATLSMLYPDVDGAVTSRVAWAPIIDPKKYFHDTLRVNVTSQTIVYKKVIHNREQLIDRISKGGTVNIDGYELGNPLWDEANNIDPAAMIPRNGKPALVVHISPSGRADKGLSEFISKDEQGRFEQRIIREMNFWAAQRLVYPGCNSLFTETLEWISRF